MYKKIRALQRIDWSARKLPYGKDCMWAIKYLCNIIGKTTAVVYILISFTLLTMLASLYIAINLPAFIGGKTPLDVLAALAQLLIVAVGSWYAWETRILRKQNDEQLKKLDEQAEIQKKQYFNGIKPVLCLSYKSTPKTVDIVYGKFEVKNITDNPAFSVACICITEKGENTIFYTREQDDLPSIEGKGSLPVNGFSLLVECEQIKTKIIENYGENFFKWIQNPKPLPPTREEAESTHIIFLYKDLRGNSYITQRDLSYTEDRLVDEQLDPSDLGRERFFAQDKVRERWEGKKKK